MVFFILTRFIFVTQARDRTQLLELSVAEAQQSETNIAQFQEWLDHVHAQIISRIENDLTSDDLPDDVQVNFCFVLFTIIILE
jgi:hypothetical protein